MKEASKGKTEWKTTVKMKHNNEKEEIYKEIITELNRCG